MRTLLGMILACASLLVPTSASAGLRIIPEPQHLQWNTGPGFEVSARTRIVVNANPDAGDLFIAGQLRRKIWDTTGRLVPILKSRAGAPTGNVIAIGDPARNKVLAAILKSWPDAAGKAARSEGYVLGVRGSTIVVRGFDQRGTFYGCQTLIQIFEYCGRKRINSLFCYDYPDMPWRGTMVRIRQGLDVELTKELVSEVMARYKLNTIELHMSYGVLWPSHPELHLRSTGHSGKPTKFGDIKSVADCAKRHFMQVIPSGVSWTHSWEWQTADGLNRDILEDTDSTGSSQNLCWRNPKARKLVRDLMNDQIRIFKPKYLHIGWDEVGTVGVCPLCRGTDPAKLFSEALWSDRNYLTARGITPIMWADMLRRDQNGGGGWKLYRTVSTMPKDIIVQDWFYTGHHTDFPSLKTWNNNGLKSLGTPYGVYKPGMENIFSWAEAAKRHKILGIVAFNKYRCGDERAAEATEIGCFPFIAEWSWSVGRPPFAPQPYDGWEMAIRELSPRKPAGFVVSAGGGRPALRWTNPPDSEFAGTWVCSRTDRFPTDPLDGTFVCDKSGLARQAERCVDAKAPKAAVVYYSAFSHDAVRHFSAPARTALRR